RFVGEADVGDAAICDAATGFLAIATRGEYRLEDFFCATVQAARAGKMALVYAHSGFECRHFFRAENQRRGREHGKCSFRLAADELNYCLLRIYLEGRLASSSRGLLS